MIRAFILTFASSLLCLLAFSQQLDYNEIVVSGDPEQVFDRTLDYLHDSPHFVESVDKDAGFLQAKIFLKSRRVLSSLDGTRLTLNFLIRSMEGGGSKIRLRVHVDEKRFGGNAQSRIYYYEEKGITTDEKVYQEILESLQEYLDAFR